MSRTGSRENRAKRMKQTISKIRHAIHLLVIGVILSLFLSTTVAAYRITTTQQVETGAVELASAIEMADLSLARNSPCTGEGLFPSRLAKEITETAAGGALEFKDRYTVCSKTVDKECVIVGLTEARK